MLNLREYRSRADRLADHLPWAALVAPGIVLNKDGSFQKTLRFRGPDLESATQAELLDHRARQQCAAPVRLGLGAPYRGAAPRGAVLSGQQLPRCGLLAGR
jgi:type IV secretion system protein VirB4